MVSQTKGGMTGGLWLVRQRGYDGESWLVRQRGI